MSYAQDLQKAARERRIRMSAWPGGRFSYPCECTGRLARIPSYNGEPQPPRITVKEIIRAVSKVHKVTPEDIIGERRASHIVLARHHAVALAVRYRPDLSLPRIGQLFGDRDHTTVMNSRARWETTLKHRYGAYAREVTRAIFKDAEPMIG